MFRSLSKYSAFFTILIHLTEIHCCSLSTNEILALLSQNPEYKKDPCYIEWQFSERGKQYEVLKRREEERQRLDDDRKQIDASYQLYLNYLEQQKQQANAIQERKQMKEQRESSLARAILVFVGVVVGIIGCVVCVTRTKICSSPANIRQSHSSSGGDIPITLTFVAANTRIHNTGRNQRISNLSTNNDNDNFTNNVVLPHPQQSETNAPLRPRGTRSQNSLPSYEDAVKMTSMAPKE